MNELTLVFRIKPEHHLLHVGDYLEKESNCPQEHAEIVDDVAGVRAIVYSSVNQKNWELSEDNPSCL